ncbi:MAG: metallophosphoesterase [Pirellulaceae bacterium]
MDYFLSDLHLFSLRSEAQKHELEIRARVADARTFVLGGDIFDFAWTIYPDIDSTINAAMDWLEALMEINPECEFHYLLGNHDCHPEFVEQLSELAQRSPNLQWDPYFLRIGSAVMLHGDVVHLRRTTNYHLAQARSNKAANETKRSAMRNHAYRMVVRARVHALVGKVANPKWFIARQIMQYLRNEGHPEESGLENVYFGHTHVPLADYDFSGVRFHNGGASISGLNFRIVEMELDPPG